MATEYTVRSDDVSWTPTDDDLVIVMDLRTSRYLSLNSAAAVLWTMLTDGATRDSLVSGLAERFGLEPTRAELDVDAFLVDLRARELVTEQFTAH